MRAWCACLPFRPADDADVSMNVSVCVDDGRRLRATEAETERERSSVTRGRESEGEKGVRPVPPRQGVRQGGCTCVCMCVRACVHWCVRACVRASACACARACACVRPGVRACMCLCVHACVCARPRAYLCARAWRAPEHAAAQGQRQKGSDRDRVRSACAYVMSARVRGGARRRSTRRRSCGSCCAACGTCTRAASSTATSSHATCSSGVN